MSNKTHNINVTERELMVIMAALQVVSPSGGGSEPFNLYRKLNGGHCGDDDADKQDHMNMTIMSMYKTAIEEAIEAEVIKVTLSYQEV